MLADDRGYYFFTRDQGSLFTVGPRAASGCLRVGAFVFKAFFEWVPSYWACKFSLTVAFSCCTNCRRKGGISHALVSLGRPPVRTRPET